MFTNFTRKFKSEKGKAKMRFLLLPIPSNPYNYNFWVWSKAIEVSTASQHYNASFSWVLCLSRSEETQDTCDNRDGVFISGRQQKENHSIELGGVEANPHPLLQKTILLRTSFWLAPGTARLNASPWDTKWYQDTMWTELPIQNRVLTHWAIHWVDTTASYQQVPWGDGSDFFDTYLDCITSSPPVHTYGSRGIPMTVEERKSQSWFTSVSVQYSSTNQR